MPARAKTANGNDLALEFSSADAARQKEIRGELAGQLHFFRYLKIDQLEKSVTNGQPCIRMSTIEPSSEMRVDFVIKKGESLKKAAPLKKGECLAVTGRIESIQDKTKRIVLNPVIVRYKDRLSPKLVGKEVMSEVDPDALYGTSTDAEGNLVKVYGKDMEPPSPAVREEPISDAKPDAPGAVVTNGNEREEATP